MSNAPITPSELAQILGDLGEDFIDVAEAVRRLCILETEPGRYNCGTCQFHKNGECRYPGRPPMPMDPMSARCGWYEWRDPRADAMPVEAKAGSKMFK